MKNNILYSFITALLLLAGGAGQAQEKDAWTLPGMIAYATAHNIQVKQAQLGSQNYQADYEQARASRLPTLSISGQQSLTAGQSIDPVTSEFVAQDIHATSLSLNSQLTLFNGNRVNNSIKQNALLVQSGQLAVEEAKNSIVVALTQVYLQALYNREAVGIAQETVNTSQKQVERMQALVEAGSARAGELAQLRSQLAGDKAALVAAQNQYDAQLLTLKQLLELELNDDFAIATPEVSAEPNGVLVDKNEAYRKALAQVPEVKNSRLGINIAQLDLAQAKAGYLPTVALTASVGTGYTSVQDFSCLDQFDNNRNERVGLSVSIPIFNQKKTSTSVQKARVGTQSAKLQVTATQKEVLQKIENTYQSVVAGQSQLEAAREQLSAAEESFRLAEEQFGLGMLNAVDFLLQKTNYLFAQQSYSQAKYSVLLNNQLLEFYQGNPIQL
jgi:outer membrane protein